SLPANQKQDLKEKYARAREAVTAAKEPEAVQRAKEARDEVEKQLATVSSTLSDLTLILEFLLDPLHGEKHAKNKSKMPLAMIEEDNEGTNHYSVLHGIMHARDRLYEFEWRERELRNQERVYQSIKRDALAAKGRVAQIAVLLTQRKEL